MVAALSHLVSAAIPTTVDVNQSPTVLIVAAFGFGGSIAVALLNFWLTRVTARRADAAAAAAAKAATDAQLGIETARVSAARAEVAAADAATELVRAAQSTDHRLDQLQRTANDTKTVTEGTHLIVNSQRTKMLRTMAIQSRLIAKLLPDDAEAQLAAETAEAEADQSEAAAAAIDHTGTKQATDAIIQQDRWPG